MTFTHAVGWALIHFLWQGAAIALGLRLILAVLARRSASIRYAIATAAFLAMPAITGYTAARAWTAAREPMTRSVDAVAAADGTSPESAAPAAHVSDGSIDRATNRSEGRSPRAAFTLPAGLGDRLRPLLPGLVLVWLAGVALLAVRHLAGWTEARRLTRQGTGVAPERWVATLQQLARRLGVRRTVTLLTSTVVRVPAVVGWLRPVVLLPLSALSGLTVEQIELLLAHELAHIKRLDYLINVLQSSVEVLLFYHPAVWWVSARIREEREHCCDDLAVSVQGDPVAYAEALFAMEQLRWTAPPAPALAATGGTLLARVRRLVGDANEPKHAQRWIGGVGAVLAVVLIAVIGSVRWADAMAAAPMKLTSPEAAALTCETPSAECRVPSAKSLDERTAASIDSQDPKSMAPDTVIRHPDPNAPLASRFQWAQTEAKRYKTYWVGYAIQSPWPGSTRSIYVGRMLRYGIQGSGITITGRVINIDDQGSVKIPGVRMLTLVGGRPDDIALVLGFGGRAAPGALERAQASTVALPVDLGRRPLLWLGSADDDESVALLKRLWDGTSSQDALGDLVGAFGVHRSSNLVVPILSGILQGSGPDERRKSAAEWLGWHADPAALAVLTRVARGDRSREVRREAAESVGSVDLPAAADSIISLARTLEDREVRKEAVEAMSERQEPEVLRALIDIARNDPDLDVQKEAVEALGELSDHRGVPALLDLAENHPEREVRKEAVETIGEAAEPGEALKVLERIAKTDDDEDVQREAVETIGEVHDDRGIAILRALAREHPSVEVRKEAVETLKEADPSKAFDLLKGIALQDQSQEVRREAVETLGELEDPRVVATLVEVAERADVGEDVQREAVEALGETERPGALTELARLAETHPHESIRREAVETYGEHGKPADAVQLFRRLLAKERSEDVQHQILETLGELDGNVGVPVLLDIARNHPNRELRRKAIRQLGEVDEEAARGELKRLLEKP